MFQTPQKTKVILLKFYKNHIVALFLYYLYIIVWLGRVTIISISISIIISKQL